MEQAELTRAIIGSAMTVHRVLGFGFDEIIYKNALTHELRKSGLTVLREKAVEVRYDGAIVGTFAVDMIVDSIVLVEAKAVRTLVPRHEVQTVNYLTATGIDLGLLLNFGSDSLQFKRKYRNRLEPIVAPDLLQP